MLRAIRQLLSRPILSPEVLAILVWFIFCLTLITIKRSIFPLSPPRSFLVNNLLWGMLPWVFSLFFLEFLSEKETKTPKLLFAFFFILWIIFLPNSLYIFTDFVHLEKLKSFSFYILEGFTFPYWIDLIIFINFGLLSFYLGLLSIFHWHIFLRKLSKIWCISLLVLTFLLAGIGVYLGRFIRLFSWQALWNPFFILIEIERLLSYPYALVFCLSLSGTCGVAYFLFFSARLKSNDK